MAGYRTSRRHRSSARKTRNWQATGWSRRVSKPQTLNGGIPGGFPVALGERNADSAAVTRGPFERREPRNPGGRARAAVTFRYSERNQEEYRRDGLTILRGLIPASLLTDLRREADKAREIARRERG